MRPHQELQTAELYLWFWPSKASEHGSSLVEYYRLFDVRKVEYEYFYEISWEGRENFIIHPVFDAFSNCDLWNWKSYDKVKESFLQIPIGSSESPMRTLFDLNHESLQFRKNCCCHWISILWQCFFHEVDRENERHKSRDGQLQLWSRSRDCWPSPNVFLFVWIGWRWACVI